MTELKDRKCEPCDAGGQPASPEQIAEYMRELPEWKVIEKDGEKQIERAFQFKNFAQAIAFADRVGELAEDVGHHPLLIVEWGQVTVRWWTHKIGGLHEADFIMAARTDAL